MFYVLRYELRFGILTSAWSLECYWDHEGGHCLVLEPLLLSDGIQCGRLCSDGTFPNIRIRHTVIQVYLTTYYCIFAALVPSGPTRLLNTKRVVTRVRSTRCCTMTLRSRPLKCAACLHFLHGLLQPTIYLRSTGKPSVSETACEMLHSSYVS